MLFIGEIRGRLSIALSTATNTPPRYKLRPISAS